MTDPSSTYVRVKQVETGHELSVPRSHYEANQDGYRLLDKPATHAAGDPLPAKHKTTVTKAAEKKARKADTKEE